MGMERMIGRSGAMGRTVFGRMAAFLATALFAGIGGCATSPPLSPTIVILGAVEVAAGARLPPGSRVTVRLTRGGQVIDELAFDAAASPPPYAFQLLYDREQVGGVGAITAEARRSGRVVLATLEAVAVPLDGTPRTAVCRLAPPRRAIGP